MTKVKKFMCSLAVCSAIGSMPVYADVVMPGPTKVTNIVIGYGGGVLVRFNGDAACNGLWESFLSKDNVFFDEIYSALLMAKATQSDVTPRLLTSPPVHDNYCTLLEMSIGENSGEAQGWRPYGW